MKTTVGPSHWTAECRIPFQSVGAGAPHPQATWGVNLTRTRRAPHEEHSSLAGLTHFYHPRDFGRLVFGNPAEVSYSLLSIGDRDTDYELRVRFGNTTKQPIEVETSWASSAAPAIEPAPVTITRLEPGERKEALIPCRMADSTGDVPVGLTVAVPAVLSVVQRNTGYLVTAKRGLLIEEPRINLAIDRYYYKADAKQMRVSITNRTGRGSAIRVQIDGGPDGSTVSTKEVARTPDRDAHDISFNIADWPQGRYVVSAHVRDDAGKPLQSIHRVMIKREIPPGRMPASGGKVTIRSDGILILDGKPFFPFFSTTADRQIRENPDWWGPAADSFNVRYGSFGLVANPMDRPKIGLPWVTHEDGVFFILLPEEEPMLEGIRRVVSARKDDRSILSWFIKYEAQYALRRGEERTRLDNVEEFRKIGAFVKSIDTNHLTSIHTNQPQLLPAYKDLADIIEIALRSSSYAIRMIPNMVDDHVATRRLIGPGKPYIFWLGASIPHAKYRTAEEMRCAAYLTVMGGAAGIVFHMGHDGVAKESTRHWSVYAGLSREVEALFPILSAPQREPAPKISFRSDRIYHLVRRYNGRLYLIAVNTADHLIEATVSVEDAFVQPDRVVLPFENREIAIINNGFKDTFTAYEPHVYRF